MLIAALSESSSAKAPPASLSSDLLYLCPRDRRDAQQLRNCIANGLPCSFCVLFRISIRAGLSPIFLSLAVSTSLKSGSPTVVAPVAHAKVESRMTWYVESGEEVRRAPLSMRFVWSKTQESMNSRYEVGHFVLIVMWYRFELGRTAGRSLLDHDHLR